jgi:uncharacterized protein (TIGR01777 family)
MVGMDVAVTGSSGFIGSSLCEELTSKGHRVCRIVRDAKGEADSIRWAPSENKIDAGGIDGIDAVVHLAGEPIGAKRWTESQKRAIFESRVQSTSLLARTLEASPSPPTALISGSAVGYYGDCGDQAVTESNPAGHDLLAEVAVAWEEAAAPAIRAGVRVCFSRTGIVLDSNGGALAQQLPIFRLGLGGRIGSGQQYWSWISLRDQVDALIWLLENDVSGPFNLTAPNPVTNAEFTTELGNALHRRTFLPTPSFALYAKLGQELAKALLFTSTRALPAALDASGFNFSHQHLKEAFADILGKDKTQGVNDE